MDQTGHFAYALEYESIAYSYDVQGGQRLRGRVLDLRPRGRGFETHWRYCVVVREQDTFILA